MGQLGNTVEYIFSVQYDPFQNTITTSVTSDVQRKISFTKKSCEDGSNHVQNLYHQNEK